MEGLSLPASLSPLLASACFRSTCSPHDLRVGYCWVEHMPESAQHGLAVFVSDARRNGLVERCDLRIAFRPVDGLGKLLDDKLLDHVIESALVRGLPLQSVGDRCHLPVLRKDHLRVF